MILLNEDEKYRKCLRLRQNHQNSLKIKYKEFLLYYLDADWIFGMAKETEK